MKKILICLAFLFISNISAGIDLVLSGGGARGIAHIGVLQVLEEEGIPIKRITGNSMGAVVGGLYASGYNSRQLEQIVRDLPWHKIFVDEPDRNLMSLDQKQLQERYLVSLPVRKNQVQLPSGLVLGNKMQRELSRLLWPVRNTTSFQDLPIPFMVVATDLNTGEAVVIKSGNLGESILASMSIPSVFRPREIQGKLLADGLMTRNFPVEDAKKENAELILGVDVGNPKIKPQKLNTLVRILDQSVSFQNMQTNSYQRSLCDVLILPEVFERDTSDFDHFSEFIDLGRMAATKALPELFKKMKLAGISRIQKGRKPLENLSEPALIEGIEIEGLKVVEEKLILKELDTKPPAKRSHEQIQKSLDRIYASQFFESIRYTLRDGLLRVIVKEKDSGDFNIGFNFNSEDRVSFLLNSSLRMFGFKNIRSYLDLKLGRRIRFENQNFVLLNNEITDILGFRTRFFYEEREPGVYLANQLVDRSGFDTFGAEALLGRIQNSNQGFGVGIRLKQHYLKDGYAHLNLEVEETEAEVFAVFLKDTVDSGVFPKKGSLIHLEYSRYPSRANSESNQTKKTWMLAKFYPLNSKNTIFGVFKESRLDGKLIGYHGRESLGGKGRYLWDQATFIGYDRGRFSGNYIQSLLVGWQTEFLPDVYLRTLANIGQATSNQNDLWKTSKMAMASGIELGRKMRFGSAEFGIYHNREDRLSSYISLGHRF